MLLLSQEIHPIPPTKGAAVEQWIYAVTQRLSRYKPYVVSVPHPWRPNEEQEQNVHFHRIQIGRLYTRIFRKITRLDPWSYTDRVAQYAKRMRIDIIHVHNAPKIFEALAQKKCAKKYILHMHNEKNEAVHEQANALVGCSEYIKNWYKNKNFPAKKFVALANGIDAEMYPIPSRNSTNQQALRHLYEIPPNKFIVMYVGRVSPEKGPDLLIQAFNYLDLDKYHLVMLGEWPKGMSTKNTRVKFAEELKPLLGKISHTLIDVVSPEEVPRLYQLGDLMMIPSRFEEPFSMVAIEAMAAGLPVMALRRGGMAEYMTHQVNSLVLDPDSSPSQIAQAIQHALANRASLVDLSINARNLVIEKFTWERVAKSTEALYDELLAE